MFARPIGRALIEARIRRTPPVRSTPSFARPIGRALIEAGEAPFVFSAPQGGLHGQLAVPSLKRKIVVREEREDGCLHGQLAVPSLKRITVGSAAMLVRRLHGQLAVPSLKRRRPAGRDGPAGLFARPIGRALIEAWGSIPNGRRPLVVCTANWPCPH